METQSLIDPYLINSRQVAIMYGISERSVWRLCQIGQLPPPVRLGARVTRWRLADLFNHIGDLDSSPDEQPYRRDGSVIKFINNE